MRKALLAAAVIGIAGLGFAGGAQAQSGCAWNGYNWVCPPSYNYGPQYYGMYPYESEGGSFPDVNGYKPPWLPSYPGPRAAGGAGH